MNEKSLSLARHADFRQMLDNGVAIVDEVQELADTLAAKMHRIHGGSWSVVIDHSSQFVAICQDDFGGTKKVRAGR